MLELHSFSPTSFLFVFVIRAFSGLEEGKKDEYLKQAWDQACKAGVANQHVLFELEEASIPLFRELLNPFRKQVAKEVTREIYKSESESRYDKRYHEALQKLLPASWTRRAEAGTAIEQYHEN